MNLTFKHDEKITILKELKFSFCERAPLIPTSNMQKVVKALDEQFEEFYVSYENALHELYLIMHRDNNIRTNREIDLMLDNKRYHNLDDAEIVLAKKWFRGQNVKEDVRPVYFDYHFDVENIQEFINHVIDTQNV